MGGAAFAHHTPPLKTPRMPPEIYKSLRDSIFNILLRHYTDAKTPLESPGKPDFGDIDVLVHGPLTPDFDPSITPKHEVARNLATRMNARAWICEKGPNSAINLALKWPKKKILDVKEDGSSIMREFDDPVHMDDHVQVDIHVCQDYKSFRWAYFHAAHGDLWNILGSTIRGFGLTVNNKGMFIRIPEIELVERKKSMVYLTDDPVEILGFLGLDSTRWFRVFESREEMFVYAAGCRLFWVKEQSDLEEGEMEGDVLGEIDNGGQLGGEAGKKKLKHNDRQRMAKRPIFREWIEEFIPRLRAEGKYSESKATREQVRDEAFVQFGVKEEWEERLKVWLLGRHMDELKAVIKGGVPEMDPQARAATIREMKEIIMEGLEFMGSVPEAAIPNSEGFYNLDLVRKFIAENWEAVKEIGWKHQLERANNRMSEAEVALKRHALFERKATPPPPSP